jgi:tripartite-type tricarboxylate transporter receptor subunit TctC
MERAGDSRSGLPGEADPRVIVPFAAGGPNDILARLIGQKLAESWGQPVLVEPRPGGGTVIGTEAAARSAPEGYTLLMVSVSQAVAPVLREKLPFDPLRDFTPVIRLANAPNGLVVHPSLPVKSVRELVALARARPGQIAFGSGGIGTMTHLAAELLRSSARLDVIHVPYKGASPALVDLLSGQTSFMFVSILPALPHVHSDRMRALAVSGAQRASTLPQVPAVAETLPGFEASAWFGLFAPAGTPPEIVGRLNAEIGRILRAPEIGEHLAREGTEAAGGSSEEFGRHFRAEMENRGKVVRAAGIKPE